ncbi:hypothetical protein MMC06_005321 [Schaereria dolodes]|nr:hypothetical protein [Schaereria dolodes]
MHCYFVLAGDASIPVLYHVERVREGKSFMTRTVQARQRGKCIFTATASFMREGSGGEKVVEHECGMPEGVKEGLEEALNEEEDEESIRQKEANGEDSSGPFVSKRLRILNNDSPHPHAKKTRQWIKARGRISPSGSHQAHLSALAYMSDSYFIGTVSRVHNLWRLGRPHSHPSTSTSSAISASAPSPHPNSPQPSPASLITSPVKPHPMAVLEAKDNSHLPPHIQWSAPSIGMMVSLDHTIYFHRPRAFRADDWLFSEMESPWAGDGRGLVLQKIWDRGGRLVATCVQEGLVRLKQDEDDEKVVKSKL